MSNCFRLHQQQKNIDEWLLISNAGTTVLLTVLGLSGSIIAQSDKEKELMLWILEHDQEVKGLGNAGFDISDIPWDYNNFQSEKEFINKVIDGAKQKLGWTTLDYEPNEERLFDYLYSFQRLINEFDFDYIDRNAYGTWVKENEDPRFTMPNGYPKCEKHGILLYWHGCIACNDH